MTKYIGIDDGEQGLICFDCAYNKEIKGLLFTLDAYPDGFTCDECFNSIADQGYQSEDQD